MEMDSTISDQISAASGLEIAGLKIQAPEQGETVFPRVLEFRDIVATSLDDPHCVEALPAWIHCRGEEECLEALIRGIEPIHHPAGSIEYVLRAETGSGIRTLRSGDVDFIAPNTGNIWRFSQAACETRRKDCPGITVEAALPVSCDELRGKTDDLVRKIRLRPEVHDHELLRDVEDAFYGVRYDFSRAAGGGVSQVFLHMGPVRSVKLNEGREIPVARVALLPEEERGYLVHPRDFEILHLLDNIRMHLSGNDVEYDFSRRCDVLLKPDFWEKYYIEDRNLYVKFIHPEALRVVRNIFDSGLPPEGSLIDVMGGDGHFAQLLKGWNPVVVEQSVEGVERAKSRGLHTVQCDVCRCEDLAAEVGARPALVTAIGGLTRQVISRREAFRLTERLFNLLLPGGFFVLTGRTPVHLNARDFSSFGFEVVNCWAGPPGEPHGIHDLQMYVLRKPGR